MISSISPGGATGSLLTYGLLTLILYVAYQLALAVKRNAAIRKLGGQRAYVMCSNPVTGMTYQHLLPPVVRYSNRT